MKQVLKQQILLFTLLVIFNGSFCLDPFYEDCVPKHCGDGMSIRFPFFIRGLHEPHCGYPGFELVCNDDGLPVLSISGNNYSFENIDYKAGSMRLLNYPTITCNSSITNVTLGGNLFWMYGSSTSELVFLTDCTKEVPKNLTRYMIGSCDPAVQLVMLSDDSNLGSAKEVCTQVVVALVEEQDGERRKKVVVDGGNYAEVVKRGFTLFWSAQECVDCERSGGRCGYKWFPFRFLCFCPQSIQPASCPNGKHKNLWILVMALSVGFVTTLFLLILCFKRKLKWPTKTKNCNNVENFLKNHELLAKRYSYLQVKKMTNSFEVKLGQGGFGSVYRGVLSDGNLVAVKVLSESKGNGEDFINEVASIGKTSHVNVVSLLGFCFEGHQRALIYEFMPNGSLEKFIYNQASSSNSQLGWKKLHEIAIGIARGLEYLHIGCNTRILHFDIKPHNILLDQDFSPKISDFGLAKLFPEKRSMISMSHMIRGTPGYIAPEVYSRSFGQVSHKSDVYSYGMMILEMAGGRKNIEVEVDHTSEIYFPNWIYKKLELDDELGLHRSMSNEENEITRKMIIVGLWCIQTNPLNRPTITKALEMLEGDLSSLEIPPKPYLSSPSRLGASSITD
ncbi:LEAF RUST 10 DISEASE-RESISTANCE LOCUS RECEPTOR-LIKE PROTEIN KINASE-like 2.5 [Lactuca sativa]|nr:LEAF RUST 10 DISEASE-RESISTANCE LOCUS RECEPTOR-LIKE PROTEIN KINASE-like 2.5 [Lactuca sativa]